MKPIEVVQALAERGHALVQETGCEQPGMVAWSIIRTTSPADRPSRVLSFVAASYDAALTRARLWAKECEL